MTCLPFVTVAAALAVMLVCVTVAALEVRAVWISGTYFSVAVVSIVIVTHPLNAICSAYCIETVVCLCAARITIKAVCPLTAYRIV